jgi:hypothetical protein
LAYSQKKTLTQPKIIGTAYHGESLSLVMHDYLYRDPVGIIVKLFPIFLSLNVLYLCVLGGIVYYREYLVSSFFIKWSR